MPVVKRKPTTSETKVKTSKAGGNNDEDQDEDPNNPGNNDEDQDDDTEDEDTEDEDDEEQEGDKNKKKPVVKKPDDKVKAFTQADVDRIAAQARKDEREAQTKKQQRETTAAAAAKLKEKGEWETLYNQSQSRVEELEAELAGSKLDSLRKDIAAEFKLTPKLAKRLIGNTEEELRADAEELAAELPAPKAPNTEGGDKTKKAATEKQLRQQEAGTLAAKNHYPRM